MTQDTQKPRRTEGGSSDGQRVWKERKMFLWVFEWELASVKITLRAPHTTFAEGS